MLGNSAALPAHGRHPTSQVLHYRDQNYLLDCGEGTQMQITKFRIRTSRLQHIFITHLHGDHFYGLMGLITSMHLNQRRTGLKVFSPQGLESIVQLQLKYSNTELTYPIEFIEVDPLTRNHIGEDQHFDFHSLPMQHGIPCCGYLFQEKPRTPKFKKEKLLQYGVKGREVLKLKEGIPFTDHMGTVIPASEFLIHQPQRSFAFFGDTAFNPMIANAVRGVNTLYHESTFLNADSDRARKRFHSTASQAATIAKEAGAKQLLLGHFSGKHRDIGLFQQEAITIFPNSLATEEGKTYTID